jgi:diacylglycerol O-acyltransferase / wax synthase
MGKHAMSSADAAWLRMDSPTNLMVVNSALWFDEPVDWDRLTAVVQERIVDVFPRFRQIAVEPGLGRAPHWADYPDFDINLHLHRIALPAPGDDAALRRFMGDVMSAPLDRTKPLWHMYLIDGYRDGSAIVTRIHHAVADGISLARVMMLMTDGKPDASAPAVPFADHGAHRSRGRSVAHIARAGAGTLLHEGFESLLHPGHVADLAAAALREATGDAKALYKDLTAGSDTETILRGDLCPENRVAWSEAFPLADVKEIGKRHGATVNDVLVGAVSGAIARYLEANDGSAKTVRAMIPFNLRPLDEPIDPALGNHFALVLLELPTGEKTPLQRLRRAKVNMDQIKSSREPAVAFAILSLIGLMPAQAEKRAIDIFTAEASLVLTNVPGPRAPVYLAGTEVVGVLPWAPCSGSIGMTVTIFSYADTVRVGFMTDARRVPDPEAMARAFGAELGALSRARRAARSARRSAGAPQRA